MNSKHEQILNTIYLDENAIKKTSKHDIIEHETILKSKT